ncbi:hypothetical protein MHBO_001909 [Bonamia ostreae]|uniref:Uncharacterized protein n=1 Tax=Bonamia ostreae TaxID=126728 RepID=A0ABV2AKN0_9EUKA
MIKSEQCTPPVNGVMVATTVGGVKSQVHEEVGIPVEYPNEEVEQSLLMYRNMRPGDVDNKEGADNLYKEISSRQSVKDFKDAILKAIRMPHNEREFKSHSARNFILNNYSIHSNVHNILKTVRDVVAKFYQKREC